VKREESDVGRRLCLVERIRQRNLGLIDVGLVASLEIPRRLALLGVGVVLDDLPLSLGDGIFDVVNARGRRRRARGMRGQRRFGGMGGRLGFHAEMAESAEDRTLRRDGIVILQWNGKGVRYALRPGGTGDLQLQRDEHNS